MTLLTTNGESKANNETKSVKAPVSWETLSRTRDGVYAVDEDQRIVLWNQGAQEILGYSADETLGRYCFEVVRGTDEDGRRVCGRDCNTQTTVRQGRPGCGLNILVRAKDGTPRWLSLSHIPVTSPGNGSNAVLHVFRDATKEVEAKQLVARLSSFFAEYARSEEQEAPTSVAPYTKLTQREIDVLRLLSKGSATESIAQKLGISSTTARNHIQNILSKLGVHSRLEAVVQASRHNLL